MINSQAIQHLKAACPRLSYVIDEIGEIEIHKHSDSFLFLTHEIVGKMISAGAKRVIFERLNALCLGKITPEHILNLILLSGNLMNVPSLQHPRGNDNVFGFVKDSFPDRWGRLLLDRRERLTAQSEGRPTRMLTNYDYLIGIEDFTRMGGIRYKEEDNNGFIRSSSAGLLPAGRKNACSSTHIRKSRTSMPYSPQARAICLKDKRQQRLSRRFVPLSKTGARQPQSCKYPLNCLVHILCDGINYRNKTMHLYNETAQTPHNGDVRAVF